MKSCLILGGAGFVGTNLSKFLIEKDIEVTVIDKSIGNVEKVRYICADLGDEKIYELFKGYDYVFHLAALVGVDACFQNPQDVIDANVRITEKVLSYLDLSSLKHFFYSSSSEVYGEGSNAEHFCESNSELSPKSVYGQTKLQAESIIEKHVKEHDYKTTVFRLFNAYGENQRVDFVVPKFINKALNNEEITVFGQGEQVRCFTYIGDIVEAIYEIINQQENTFDCYNIGNSKATSIVELADIVVNLTNSKSRIKFIPLDSKLSRPSSIEIHNRTPKVIKLADEIGYTCTTQVLDGVQRIINEQKQQLI